MQKPQYTIPNNIYQTDIVSVCDCSSPTIKRLVLISFTQYPVVKFFTKLKCSPSVSLPAYNQYTATTRNLLICRKTATNCRLKKKCRWITFLLLPTWYTNFLFINTNYIKLNSSTCFERNPLIIRRSMTQIVHMQPLVSSLSASDRLVQPLRQDSW